MKPKLNPITRALTEVFVVTFLVFILPGWNARTLLIAQIDPTKASSEATASAQPTETLPVATEAPAPTKAQTPSTPEPQPTKDSGGIGIESGQWVYVTTENFEELIFPAPGWTVQDLSNDGFERFWDDDYYRAHLGAWAAWPANGGANGFHPTLSNHHYPNNLNTRLIYGPFDLSEATRADTDFYLWRELEANYDYLAFEVSHDGVTFQELMRWSTTDTTWRFQDVYYDSYVGDRSVWLSFRFYSDSTLTYEGPWLDDIHVWKFLPNPPTAMLTRTATRTPTRTATATPTPTPTRTPAPQPQKVYLPIISDYFSIKAKSKSGIHLGSRSQDWNWTPTGGSNSTDFLSRLRGDADGIYPAAVVVLSNNLYTIERNGPGCTVSNATIRSPYLFNYLKDAYQQAETKIIIRIYPSPGNFTDAVNIQQPINSSHDLMAQPGITPENNRNYCGDPKSGDDKDSAPDYYRAIDDIAAEMGAIHALNVSNGILSHEFFLPANEPNIEWYAAWYNQAAVPKNDNADAWRDMDAYFSALYDYVHTYYPGIQVLTPSMAQAAYAEAIAFASCEPSGVVGGGSGYDSMPETYLYKNDGYAWNNYWSKGQEYWSDNFCPSSGNPPTSQHVFQYFPLWLQEHIGLREKPAFITEADLDSPCHISTTPIQDKDVSNGDEAQQSLWLFMSQERAANYLIAWLLTESPHYGVSCHAGYPNEVSWHEAYREDGTEHPWFPKWWLRQE